jgi:2-succinyl-5-enolpyruvyl-6-hydroxy-3-cyclohexene-1-carboxylate synthase
VPAAVICTSGTAVANLLPAVTEAHHSGVPLLLLTADRPPELRGIGANQTTTQPGMFAAFTRYEADVPVPDTVCADGAGEQSLMLRALADEALDAALGVGTRPAGPVHLNLPFREPLAGSLPEWFAEAEAPTAASEAPAVDADEHAGALYQGGGGIGESDVPDEPEAAPHLLAHGPRTVVVAGSDAGPDAEQLAHAAGWPLVAEIVSGARFGRELVHGYRALLRDPDLGGRIERVVVLGHPTLSREVTALLSRSDVEVVALRGTGETLNLNGATVPVDAVAVVEGEADREWLGAWMRASHAAAVDLAPAAPDAAGLASADPAVRLGAITTELSAIRAQIDRETLVDAVWRATWPHDRLVFGSSRLVRVADAVLGGKKVPVHANRGLAGIDGTIATGIGVAVASQDAAAPDAAGRTGVGTTRVLLGDLTLLHDLGAFVTGTEERTHRVQVVVGNDHGGAIFRGLEVARTTPPEDMRRMMSTPQHVDVERVVTGLGWEYRRAETWGDLERVLTDPAERVVIEVPLAD